MEKEKCSGWYATRKEGCSFVLERRKPPVTFGRYEPPRADAKRTETPTAAATSLREHWRALCVRRDACVAFNSVLTSWDAVLVNTCDCGSRTPCTRRTLPRENKEKFTSGFHDRNGGLLRLDADVVRSNPAV